MSAARLTLVAGLLCAALVAGALAARAGEDGCSLYVYLDQEGMLVRTVRLADVPADKREALLTYRDCAAAKALRAAGGQERKHPPEIGRLETDGALPTAEAAASASGAPADGWKRWGLAVRLRMLPTGEAVWLYASAAAALVGLLGLLVGLIGRQPLGAAAAYLALGLLSGLPAVSVLLLDGWPL